MALTEASLQGSSLPPEAQDDFLELRKKLTCEG
jgi:hypothetical protein